MRGRLLLILLALPGACGDPDAGREEALAAAAEDSDRIECATEGAAAFERASTIERSEGSDGLILTLRSPSGGFRRLLVTKDGRGVVAADGADPALVSVIADDRIEVRIAADRYRLPARVGK